MRRSVSLALQTDKPLAAYGALAAQAEAHGFDAVTVYNDMLYQPAWLPLMEIARHTRRVRLGPAAVNPFTCHPINIAGNIALVDEAAGGRAYLGMARGAWLDFVGLRPPRAAQAMREAFECVQHLLAQSVEPYPGQFFSLAGGDSLRWNLHRSNIPFLLGSWGRKTIQACLPSISEIKVGGTVNPPVVAQVRSWVTEAAGQNAGADVVVGAVTVVDEDGAAAREMARRSAALYLPIIAALDHSLAIEPERLERINAAAAAYDFDGAASEVSDDLLSRLAFAGTPDDVAAQAAALYEAGAARVEFGTPHGLTAGEGLNLLGTKVLPALRASGILPRGD